MGLVALFAPERKVWTKNQQGHIMQLKLVDLINKFENNKITITPPTTFTPFPLLLLDERTGQLMMSMLAA